MLAAWRRLVLQALSPAGKRARLLILTFHQVPREPDALMAGIAHGDPFEMQMRWLADFCEVLPLADAVGALTQNKLPARAACITFDDGYLDNLEVAAPILERLSLPATFFITTGAVERGIMWNDLVIEGVRRAEVDLDLTALGFGVHSMGSTGSRKTAIRSLIDQIKYRPLEQRLGIAEKVFAAATDETEPRLMMTRRQVVELAERGFDIGAHTVSHPILEKLPVGIAREEIEQSRKWLADATGIAPRTFAYPNGRFGTDFSSVHEQQVEAAGYDLAVSTDWGATTRRSRRTALPRFAPWERSQQGYWLRLVKTLVRSYLDRWSRG